MSAVPAHEPLSSPGRPAGWMDATPAQVRAALLPEQVDAFDAAWREALASAAESFDLAPVTETLAVWRHWARLAISDPDQVRRLLAIETRLSVASESGDLSREGETTQQMSDRLGLGLGKLRPAPTAAEILARREQG